MNADFPLLFRQSLRRRFQAVCGGHCEPLKAAKQFLYLIAQAVRLFLQAWRPAPRCFHRLHPAMRIPKEPIFLKVREAAWPHIVISDEAYYTTSRERGTATRNRF